MCACAHRRSRRRKKSFRRKEKQMAESRTLDGWREMKQHSLYRNSTRVHEKTFWVISMLVTWREGTGYGQGHLGKRSEKWGLKQTNKQTKNRNAGPKAFRMQTIVKNSRTRASLGRSRTGGVEFPRVCNDEVDVNSPGFSGETPHSHHKHIYPAIQPSTNRSSLIHSLTKREKIT